MSHYQLKMEKCKMKIEKKKMQKNELKENDEERSQNSYFEGKKTEQHKRKTSTFIMKYTNRRSINKIRWSKSLRLNLSCVEHSLPKTIASHHTHKHTHTHINTHKMFGFV